LCSLFLIIQKSISEGSVFPKSIDKDSDANSAST
jgi:hypothetical protein